MKSENPIEKAREFLNSITKNSCVCILHDTDPDGICAAVIIAKCIHKLRGQKIELRLSLQKRKMTEGVVERVKQSKVTHLIIADFSADQYPDELRLLARSCRIMVIDHHALHDKFDDKKIIICKPQLFTKTDPAQYCTSKIAYDITTGMVTLSNEDWLAAAGCVADMATKPWQEWLKSVFRKYGVIAKSDLFETDIGRVASAIVNTEVYDKKLVNTCYEYLYKAREPKEILNSALMKYKRIIDKELDKHKEAFIDKAKKYKDLWIYEINTKYEIQGPLSTLLCLKYPHKTIIIINTNSHARVSARRYDQKVHVDKIMIKSTKTFKGANAGGYKHSAGARFDSKYLKEFRKQVIKWQT